MPRVVVTGGAGYIGSHTLRALHAAGYEVIVYDSMVRGHRQAVGSAPLVVGDIADGAALDRLFAEYRPEAVVHFAAFIEAGESVLDPAKYFRNNTAGTLSLLEAMHRNDVKQIVFSSTAAVYGEPVRIPIGEDDPKLPTNAYGLSKLMVEEMLDWFHRSYGLRSVSLRYFNAAGDDPSGEIGEAHHPETHLIPLILQVPLGKRAQIMIFGDDYDTPDGTCIRDYIHVQDLAEAHACALNYLREGKPSTHVNLGTGSGVSVKEIIQLAESVTGRKVPVVEGPRREGDPPELVGNPAKAKTVLGWEARYRDPRAMVESAWAWLTGPQRGRYPAN